jgi:hypothetical protein
LRLFLEASPSIRGSLSLILFSSAIISFFVTETRREVESSAAAHIFGFFVILLAVFEMGKFSLEVSRMLFVPPAADLPASFFLVADSRWIDLV